MPDPKIVNEHIIGYNCSFYAPDDIKKSLVSFAETNNLDQFFYVTAVKNIKNVYVEKGFIYTTRKNFLFLKNIIEGKNNEFNSEDVFSFTDETGFPLLYDAYISNVYELGESNYSNKLFCTHLPEDINEKQLSQVFSSFTTKKTKNIRNRTDVMKFPIVKIRETHQKTRTAVIIFEDSTKDACYAYIMARRLDIFENSNKTMIFSPYIKKNQENWQCRGKRRKY